MSLVHEDKLPPGMRNNGVVRDFAAEIVAMAERGEWVDPVRLSAAQAILQRHRWPARRELLSADPRFSAWEAAT